jgi:hypothetical protein
MCGNCGGGNAGGGGGGGGGVGGGAGGGTSIPQTSVDYLVADLTAIRQDIQDILNTQTTRTQYVPISDGNLPDPEIIFESDEGDIVFIEVLLP